MTVKISAIARLKELRALQGAWKCEISACQSAIANPSRIEAELERERDKLARQQETVDRMVLRAENAEKFQYEAMARLAEITAQVEYWQHKAKIEHLMNLKAQLDAAMGLIPAGSVAPAPVIAAMESADEDDSDPYDADEDDDEEEEEEEDDE